ncbi:MAG: HlyD family efflux transporter periplasmic adaptor subunit [Acidimicrobiales bacterium]
MKHPRLWILNGALVVAIGIVAYFGVTSVFHKAATTTAVRTATVSRGTVEQTETASGNISPAQDENVDFSTAGTVNSVNVTLGETVVAGQLLATLDPSTAQTALTTAEGQLSTAESNLSLAESGGETPPQVAQDNATLSSDEQNASTAASVLSGAQAQLSSDEAACAATPTTTTTTTLPPANPGSSTQGASTGSSSTGSAGSSSTGSSSAGSASAASSNPCSAVASDLTTVNQDETSLTNAQNALTQENLSIEAKRYVNPATLTQDETAITTAQQAVTNDEQALAETKLTAPFSGTVIALNGTVGETVSGGGSSAASTSSASSSTGSSSSSSSASSSGSSSAFLTLATLGNLQVVAGFPEADAVKIKVGQPATVTLSALSNTTVSGTVTETDPNPTVVSNVVTYDDTISLTNPPATVKDGMSVTVAVVVASVSNALELPSSAITTTGRISTVSLLTNGKQTTRSITVGLVGDSTTQILSGLSAGDVVVEPTVTATAGGATTATGGTARAGGFAGGGFAGGGIAGGLG